MDAIVVSCNWIEFFLDLMGLDIKVGVGRAINCVGRPPDRTNRSAVHKSTNEIQSRFEIALSEFNIWKRTIFKTAFSKRKASFRYSHASLHIWEMEITANDKSFNHLDSKCPRTLETFWCHSTFPPEGKGSKKVLQQNFLAKFLFLRFELIRVFHREHYLRPYDYLSTFSL